MLSIYVLLLNAVVCLQASFAVIFSLYAITVNEEALVLRTSTQRELFRKSVTL